MNWFKKEKDQADWMAGFEAGFRVGYDQAFNIVYDQIKKGVDFSHEKLKAQITDEIYKNIDEYVENELEKRSKSNAH